LSELFYGLKVAAGDAEDDVVVVHDRQSLLDVLLDGFGRFFPGHGVRPPILEIREGCRVQMDVNDRLARCPGLPAGHPGRRKENDPELQEFHAPSFSVVRRSAFSASAGGSAKSAGEGRYPDRSHPDL
jgi:hypothetical protein